MAKLSVAYGLCPLIDNNSLLGVSVDAVPDCVIVTIGKNIVIRYKFQDQKQVSSWSSKDKLTSPVVYNSNTSQYTAIFNHDQLRMWNEEDQLDKVKKYKFQEPLHCIIPDPEGETAFILYRCGYVASLTQALESRKSTLNKCVLKNSEYVKEQTLISCNGVKYVTLTSCNEKDEMILHVIPVISGTPSAQYPLLWNKENVILVGHTVMAKDSSCFLFTLWSDGSLFSFRFLPAVDDNFPGAFIQKVTSVSTKHPIAITPISNSHLAFFGADSSEEGAMLILLNLEFQLIQSRLHFKLYTKPPRLWNVSSHLLAAVGNNLIAVPYHLEVEQLSTLLGTHSSVAFTETSWMNTDIKKIEPIDKDAPKNLGHKLKLLRQEGHSQAVILQNVLPNILEEKDVRSLVWCLKTFSDVPESCVVQILKFCFSESESSLSNVSENGARKIAENGNIEINHDRTVKPYLNFQENKEHLALIDAVLNISVSDVCIMPYLRGVPFTTILNLLSHLNDLLECESTVPPLRVIEWLCLVLDSHYQEFLLSHNQRVLSLLTKISEEVCSQIDCLEELKKLTPLLHKLQSGKVPLRLSDLSDRKYSIETLQLY